KLGRLLLGSAIARRFRGVGLIGASANGIASTAFEFVAEAAVRKRVQIRSNTGRLHLAGLVCGVSGVSAFAGGTRRLLVAFQAFVVGFVENALHIRPVARRGRPDKIFAETGSDIARRHAAFLFGTGAAAFEGLINRTPHAE